MDATPKPQEVTYTVDKPLQNSFEDISKIRNREDKNIVFYTDKDKETQDFYWKYNRGLEKVDANKKYTQKVDNQERVPEKDKATLQNITAYQIDFSNKGGLVMPIILEFTFEDGSKLNDKKSAQIWRKDEQKVSLTYYFDKKLKSIQLDPIK